MVDCPSRGHRPQADKKKKGQREIRGKKEEAGNEREVGEEREGERETGYFCEGKRGALELKGEH